VDFALRVNVALSAAGRPKLRCSGKSNRCSRQAAPPLFLSDAGRCGRVGASRTAVPKRRL